jgi:large subunit ribosomal protein L24
MGQRIKKGDTVVVISGAEKGKTGTVRKIDAKDGRLIVEGLNRVWKHVKPSQKFPQGGRMQKEAPIHASNVQPVDPATGKGTKVKFEDRDGKRVRVGKKGGSVLGSAK